VCGRGSNVLHFVHSSSASVTIQHAHARMQQGQRTERRATTASHFIASHVAALHADGIGAAAPRDPAHASPPTLQIAGTKRI